MMFMIIASKLPKIRSISTKDSNTGYSKISSLSALTLFAWIKIKRSFDEKKGDNHENIRPCTRRSRMSAGLPRQYIVQKWIDQCVSFKVTDIQYHCRFYPISWTYFGLKACCQGFQVWFEQSPTAYDVLEGRYCYDRVTPTYSSWTIHGKLRDKLPSRLAKNRSLFFSASNGISQGLRRFECRSGLG